MLVEVTVMRFRGSSRGDCRIEAVRYEDGRSCDCWSRKLMVFRLMEVVDCSNAMEWLRNSYIG